MKRIILRWDTLCRLLSELERFAEENGLPRTFVEVEIRSGINPDAVISSWDWREGDPYKVISLP